MQIVPKILVSLILVLSLSACNLPRGAAIQKEILRDGQGENATVSIVPVTRASLPQLSTWPVTGWSGKYRWLTNGKGPTSNIIRAGDRIDLVIWDSQANSLLTAPEQNKVEMRDLVVSPAGKIFVPYIDEIGVQGMTPDVARSKIQQSLEMIVPSAQVQLSMSAGQGNSVDVVRGVQKPGTYPLPGRDYTILSLISQAGGVSNDLRNPLVRLIRGNETYEVRADNLFSDAIHNIALRGDDKIVVDEDDRYFISLGSTGTERLVYFEKEYITALEAVSIVGGLAENSADAKGVLVLRDYPADALRTDGTGPAMPQVVFVMDLTSADGLFAARKFEINPNDTVLATDSPIVGARTVIRLVGSLVGIANITNNISD